MWISKVRSVGTVETRVKEALNSLIVSRMELAIKSVGISPTRNSSSVVLDRDQRNLSGGTNGPQMTALSRPELTAMVKHDDHGMTWYDHGDSYSPWYDHGNSYSPWYDHGKIMSWSSWNIAWSWHGRRGK